MRVAIIGAGLGGLTLAHPPRRLGDSAHPMPPGGLGADIAFRDATLHEYAAVAREEAMATLSMFDDVRSGA